jgi:hypothetical protein
LRAQLVRIIVSKATIMVVAEGPYNRTEAKTNASETEIRALMEGSLMLNEPVRRVRPARINHSDPMGRISRSYAEIVMTDAPIATTVAM